VLPTAGNRNDVTQLPALLRAIPPIRGNVDGPEAGTEGVCAVSALAARRTWMQSRTTLRAIAEAAGRIVGDVSVDSATARAHQHAAGAHAGQPSVHRRVAGHPCSTTVRGPGPGHEAYISRGNRR
jgi:hypothetical protein